MIVDAITAKVQQLREKYEQQGYEVIEHPGPEEFPFEVGYFGHYRPAMLARRGSDRLVIEVREAAHFSDSLFERSEEIGRHPGWHLVLVTCDDVVPLDAPGVQGDPPTWRQLEQRTEAALRIAAGGASPIVLLALWSALEGLLRRIAVDNGIPVDRLPAAVLIPALYDHGLIPFDSYPPLMAALEVHRRVLHGYEAPGEAIDEAVRIVSTWVHALLPTPVERAA